MQAEWIGRSEGAQIDFPLVSPPPTAPPSLRVYTTRPDTIFGATYMVVAPEHPLVDVILERPGKRTDVDALRAVGLDDVQVHDAVQVIAYFNYINRIADAVDVELEPEMPPRPSSGGSPR